MRDGNVTAKPSENTNAITDAVTQSGGSLDESSIVAS
jgi:hypothetical protein